MIIIVSCVPVKFPINDLIFRHATHSLRPLHHWSSDSPNEGLQVPFANTIVTGTTAPRALTPASSILFILCLRFFYTAKIILPSVRTCFILVSLITEWAFVIITIV